MLDREQTARGAVQVLEAEEVTLSASCASKAKALKLLQQEVNDAEAKVDAETKEVAVLRHTNKALLFQQNDWKHKVAGVELEMEDMRHELEGKVNELEEQVRGVWRRHAWC